MNDYAKIKKKFLSRYYRAPDNDELNSMKKRVVQQIKRVLDGNEIDQNDEWTVKVLNDKSLMAYSTNDKCMFVTTGLLDFVNDDLLAAVVALNITCIYMNNHRKKPYFMEIIRYSIPLTNSFSISSLFDEAILLPLYVIQILQIYKFNKNLNEDAFNKAYEMTNKFGVDKLEFRQLLEMLEKPTFLNA